MALRDAKFGLILRFSMLIIIGVLVVAVSGCSPISKVTLSESDYRPKRIANPNPIEALPAKVAPLVPPSARNLLRELEPVASAAPAKAKVFISFRAGEASAPVEVRIECEPLRGGFMRCLTAKRSFGPVRDDVAHLLLAWGGLIPVAWLSTSQADPLAVSYYMADLRARAARPVSTEQGPVLFDAFVVYQGADKSLKQRVACYRPIRDRARVPEALSRLGTVQQLECVRQQFNAQGEFALSLYEGKEFTGPVFYLPDLGVALPVWMFYTSKQMRDGGFYSDPYVITPQVEGDRRNLVVRIERVDTLAGSEMPKAADQ